MEVLHHSRHDTGVAGWVADLDDLLRRVDFVSLHVPLNDETRGLIDARRLALMKPSAVLVNTARGPVVDEEALAVALEDGTIFAAGIDVYEHEPHVHPRLLARPARGAPAAHRERLGGHAPTHGAAGRGGCGRGPARASVPPTWWSPESRGAPVARPRGGASGGGRGI